MTNTTPSFHQPRMASFHKQQQYQASASLEEVQSDLALLEAHRVRLDRRYKFYGWTAVVALVTGAGLAIAQGNSSDDEGAIAAAAGVAVTILMVLLRRFHPHIEARRITLARCLIQELDMLPGSTVDLRLDLAPLQIRRKMVGKENGRKVYRDEFLALSVSLADGSHLCMQRTEQTKFRTVHHQKAIVYEWEDLCTDQIDIDLARPVLAGASPASMKAPEGMRIVELAVSGSQIRTVLVSGGRWGAHGTAARDGLLDVPAAIASLLQAAYGLAGLPEPIKSESPAWPRVRLPMFSLRSAATVLVVLGALGVIVGLAASTDLQGKDGARLHSELTMILSILVGAGVLPLSAGLLLRGSLRKRAKVQERRCALEQAPV